jgi:hypothetical protein
VAGATDSIQRDLNYRIAACSSLDLSEADGSSSLVGMGFLRTSKRLLISNYFNSPDSSAAFRVTLPLNHPSGALLPADNLP